MSLNLKETWNKIEEKTYSRKRTQTHWLGRKGNLYDYLKRIRESSIWEPKLNEVREFFFCLFKRNIRTKNERNPDTVETSRHVVYLFTSDDKVEYFSNGITKFDL